MRDLDLIDGELRLVTGAWRAARELIQRTPSTELIDQSLDERMAVRGHQRNLTRHPPCSQSAVVTFTDMDDRKAARHRAPRCSSYT